MNHFADHPDNNEHTMTPDVTKGIPRGVVAYVLDSDIEVSEFELHSRNYIHFWTNTLYLTCCRLNNTTTVQQRLIWHLIIYKD